MTINMLKVAAVLCCLAVSVGAFSNPSISSTIRRRRVESNALNLRQCFFGTSTGSTELPKDRLKLMPFKDQSLPNLANMMLSFAGHPHGTRVRIRSDQGLGGMKFTMVKCKILTCKERKLPSLVLVIPLAIQVCTVRTLRVNPIL